jgi:hypothetical protein
MTLSEDVLGTVLLGHLDFPVFLKLLLEKVIKIAPFVLLVGDPRLTEPFLIVAALFNVLAVAGAIVPKVVVIAQGQ